MDVLSQIRRQPASLRQIAACMAGPGAGDLARAASLLRNDRAICFAGMGGSRYAAGPAALYLAERGVSAFTGDASELLYCEAIARNTVFVLVSRSGRTVETVKLAAQLKRSGVPYVAVTNCPDSPLAARAAACLPIEGDLDEGVSIQSYTGGVLALVYLAAEVAGQRQQFAREVAELLPQTENALAQWERMLTDAVLPGADHWYFLGRGYSLASAGESCLLMQELARRPATCYGAAEFRQGPIEALAPGGGVVVFAPHGRTQRLNVQLAEDLVRTGAAVVMIGGSACARDVLPVPLPDVPEHLAPVLEVIPVQLAARAIGARTLSRPGQFRFAALTTENEDRLVPEAASE